MSVGRKASSGFVIKQCMYSPSQVRSITKSPHRKRLKYNTGVSASTNMCMVHDVDKQDKVGQRTSNAASMCHTLVGRKAQSRLRDGHSQMRQQKLRLLCTI